MYSVIIVGAGNIGSRHLQAFAKSDKKIKIQVIDPFQPSLDVCKTRWNEVNPHSNLVEVIFQTNYANISNNVDLAIISTSSEHRYKVLEELLQNYTCKNILLEKFLFSHEEEYRKASALIEKHPCNVYVNLMRRTFDCYKWVYNELKHLQGSLIMDVVGGSWGMASNSIHFIDLFSYLTTEVISTCSFNDPDTIELLKSKREGYVEFIGSLTAKTEKGSRLNITCHEGVYDRIDLSFKKGGTTILVEEVGDTVTTHNTTTGITEKFSYPYQSQLTFKNFTEFMEGKPSLVTYQKSVADHLAFLKAMKNLSAQLNNKELWKIT